MGIPPTGDPIALFQDWYGEAQQTNLKNPNAMTLATLDETGMPSARIVLLKHADERGFVFYTNFASQKGRHLQAHPKAALVFYWEPLGKQVRVQGPVSVVSDEEADAYYASRPRQSQLGAWASKQSQPLEGRFELERRVASYAAKYPVGAIPRPPFWSGFRLSPVTIEFWKEGAFRLHDRCVFTRSSPDEAWQSTPLFP